MASFVTQGAASATAAEAAPTVEEPLCRNYVDVHCHIVHEKFVGEEDAVSGCNMFSRNASRTLSGSLSCTLTK
jgi:hypothetical protein